MISDLLLQNDSSFRGLSTTDLLNRGREKVFQSLKGAGIEEGILLVCAGTAITKPGSREGDQMYQFHAHPMHYYLTGYQNPGGILALDISTGEWREFNPDISDEARIWANYEDYPGVPRSELTKVLDESHPTPVILAGNYGCEKELQEYILREHRLDSNHQSGLASQILLESRRVKDPYEIWLHRHAIAATTAGFLELPKIIRPGITEIDVAEELEYKFRSHRVKGYGRTELAYDTIVASGVNSAVLHFAPTEKVIEELDMVLIDAGALVGGFAGDVTRVYPASGQFTSLQKDLYDGVLAAQIKAIDRCTEGTEWVEVHRATAVDLADVLCSLGIISCSAIEAAERGIMTVFSPHGVGHMVGLGVRDASGAAIGRPDAKVYGQTVRCNIPLEAGECLTVEPGIYFVPRLINGKGRSEFSDIINFERVNDFVPFGGIRIEDDVLIQKDGMLPEVLTSAIPK